MYINQNKKTLRKIFNEKALAYHTWSGYLSIAIAIIVLPIIGILGLDTTGPGFVLLFLTVKTHKKAVKLPLAKGVKHVGPILHYVVQGLGLLAIVPLIAEVSAGGEGTVTLGLVSLLVIPIQIVSVVFFFLSARQMKKAYPEMKEVMQVAKDEYMEALRSLKNGL